MLEAAELIAFLIYTSLIFFIKDYYIIFAVLAINIILMLSLRVNIKKRNCIYNKTFAFYNIYSSNKYIARKYQTWSTYRNKTYFSL